MKCPKCQYIGFAQEDRCRNCGYDFSLSASADLAELDLPIKTGDEAIGPFADLSLTLGDGDPGRETPQREPEVRAAALAPPELPLFRDRVFDDDAPLVSLPVAPRAPVSVRKSASVRPASRPAAEEPTLDLEPEAQPALSRAASTRTAAEPAGEATASIESAPAGARLMGAVIDLVLLGSIDFAVLYFTLRLLGLELSQAASLPIVPFAVFIALLNGGYLAAFTAAGGQTIGKMVAGTRVVTAEEAAWTDRVPLGQAIVRAVAYLASALPAGLGFLPAIFGADGRAVHDRLAHTRVVRA
jgi:uncharacterized RDD family membrane protein YckC